MSFPPTIYIDLSVSALIEQAVQRGEGIIAANGALVVTTGKRTGRSPKDKFIVHTADISDSIAWSAVHQPIEEKFFHSLWQRAEKYLQTVTSFVAHLRVGADPNYSFPLKVISEYAWHNLFVCQLFIRSKNFHKEDDKTVWTMVSVPGLSSQGVRDGVYSDAAVIIHLTERKILLCGHRYAGELKKALFSVMSYALPDLGVLPMHCAANVGEQGDVALFFGLSGTGKTTLSADSRRYLLGDDEHGWSGETVFNFERGCYAKCINLSAKYDPVIWKAIRYGAVLENVKLHPTTLLPNYADAGLTQNMRVVYPIDFVERFVSEQRIASTPKVIILLTCDLYGVLPPVARLTQAQAAYYFLSGYTALVGSTEVDQLAHISPIFSHCFAAPFLLRPAEVYLKLFQKRLSSSEAEVYLVNTGWTGGSYGEGHRFDLSVSRSIVDVIVRGHAQKAEYSLLPSFQLAIPKHLSGVDPTLLDPRKNWTNPMRYRDISRDLTMRFVENAKRFQVDQAIQEAGPIWMD